MILEQIKQEFDIDDWKTAIIALQETRMVATSTEECFNECPPCIPDECLCEPVIVADDECYFQYNNLSADYERLQERVDYLEAELVGKESLIENLKIQIKLLKENKD